MSFVHDADSLLTYAITRQFIKSHRRAIHRSLTRSTHSVDSLNLFGNGMTALVRIHCHKAFNHKLLIAGLKLDMNTRVSRIHRPDGRIV